MFSWTPAIFASYPVYTTDAQFIKDEGGTRVAAVGYGISPSSSATAKGMGPAATAVGITAPYIDSSLPFGTVNVTAIALAMKSDERGLPLRPDRSQHVAGAHHGRRSRPAST